jgi:hypothetical protein
MIIIEFLFTLLLLGITFMVGFWCGKTFGSLAALGERVQKMWRNEE